MFSDELVHHLVDMLGPLGPVRAKRMFGGHGIYLGDDMFALVSEDVLYFKVDEGNIDDYRRRALEAFIYRRRGRPIALSFRQAPEEALDDEALLCAWAQRALDAARRAGKAARKRNARETEARPARKTAGAKAGKATPAAEPATRRKSGAATKTGAAAGSSARTTSPKAKRTADGGKQAAAAKSAPAGKKVVSREGTAKKTAKKTASRSGTTQPATAAKKKSTSRSGTTRSAKTAKKKTGTRKSATPATRRKAS